METHHHLLLLFNWRGSIRMRASEPAKGASCTPRLSFSLSLSPSDIVLIGGVLCCFFFLFVSTFVVVGGGGGRWA